MSAGAGPTGEFVLVSPAKSEPGRIYTVVLCLVLDAGPKDGISEKKMRMISGNMVLARTIRNARRAYLPTEF